MINSNDKFLETEPSRPQLYYKSTRPGISRLGILLSRLEWQTESWVLSGQKASRLIEMVKSTILCISRLVKTISRLKDYDMCVYSRLLIYY